MKNVVHVIPSITEEASGPSYSVWRLSESLSAKSVPVILLALDSKHVGKSTAFFKPFKMSLGPRFLVHDRGLGMSHRIRLWLVKEANNKNIKLLHNHGMWQFNSLYPGWVARKFKIPYLVSPRGSFSDYAMSHGSRFKKLFWYALQKPSFSDVSVFHATSMSEYKSIRKLGFKQPVAVIPNGIDIPESSNKSMSKEKIVLFLGRLHPIKGLDLLLPAWKVIQSQFPEWQLHIVGVDDESYFNRVGYRRKMENLSESLRLKGVKFVGPLYGKSKWKAYAEASIFVLPSYSENFGMSVAEALASGTPVVTTTGTPWKDLETRHAGKCVNSTIDGITNGLTSLMELNRDELSVLGGHGKEWMIEEFSWDTIAGQMTDVYNWTVDRNKPLPKSLILN